MLLDLDMPGKTEASGIRALHERFPAMRIVVLSATDDPEHVMGALGEGASGYIPKSSSQTVMLKALELVMSGGTYLPDTLLNKQQKPTDQTERSVSISMLTPRQIEVLCLLALGKTNKHIANHLGISEATVRTHITAIFKALNASNRLQAVRAGTRLGLVPAFDR